ncbi:MAG: CPBP family intramembrane metalloprotease [Spirochaetaceae bacterium]|nr:MAG: CPBP family intramembrane metalloprotease [Spirochaetaceae bacterium]
MRELREPAIVLALYLVPAILPGPSAGVVILDDFTLFRVVLRSAVFGLLLLYLMETHGDSSHGGVGRGSAGMPRRSAGVSPLVPSALFPSALFVFAVLLVLAGATRAVAGLLPVHWGFGSPEMHDRTGGASPVLLAAALLSVAWVEELLFRKYLLTRLGQAGLRALFAVPLAAILFAAGHAWQGPEAVVLACLAGVALGVFWMRTGRLSALVLGHGAYNLVALLITDLESFIFTIL